LTPRRLQKFKINPGEALRWEAVPLPGGRGEKFQPQSGKAAADARGVITLKGLEIPAGSGGVRVSIRRAE
ncbi:MAG: hypothetical protein AMJ81_14550, partial [Phycisphaerae bacterium SM23_33]